MQEREIIPPGSTLGILGDGQLGRMLAMAAAKLGYKVAVLGPGGRQSPAGHVAYWAEAWSKDNNVSGKLLYEFCKLVSVVMIEWENIPLDVVQRIETIGIPVRPSSDVLAIAQDRLLEKQCARALGIPVPKFWNIERIEDWWEDCWDSTTACILKTRCNGYDGKGQVRILPGKSTKDAWITLGEVPCTLETVVNFACEISVIVARSPATGEMVTYGPFENGHRGGILRVTKYPLSQKYTAPPFSSVKSRAVARARKLAEHLNVHGLLAVEFFVGKDGRVLFNEMAPRPHNSGHLTIECCDTSQFEQYVRAVCNLPLGRARFHSHGEMRNIVGEVNQWSKHLAKDHASLHLYGKSEARGGRKMGHTTRSSKIRE